MKTRLLILICVGCLGVVEWMNASTDVITPRWGDTVTELADGILLIASGENASGLAAAIEILDLVSPQTTGTDTVGTLLSPRRRHAAVRLDDGRVPLAGGEGLGGVLDGVELIDPTTGAVSQISLGAPERITQPRSSPIGRFSWLGT